MKNPQLVRELIDGCYEKMAAEIPEFLQKYSRGETNELQVLAGSIADHGERLISMLPKDAIPEWIRPITTACRRFSGAPGPQQREEAIRITAQWQPQVARVQHPDHKSALDFDELYDEFRASGRLPELFDRMIEAIEEMLHSDLIDSVAVSNSLRRLLEALKANKSASLGSQLASISMAKFAYHLVVENLKVIPFLGPSLQALQNTIAECEQEAERIQKELALQAFQRMLTKPDLDRLKRANPNAARLLTDETSPPAIQHRPVSES